MLPCATLSSAKNSGIKSLGILWYEGRLYFTYVINNSNTMNKKIFTFFYWDLCDSESPYYKELWGVNKTSQSCIAFKRNKFLILIIFHSYFKVNILFIWHKNKAIM